MIRDRAITAAVIALVCACGGRASVVGDVTGDGCADIVLGGFLEADPGQLPNIVLRGSNNRLLRQTKLGGVCQGSWSEDPFFPKRLDITGDVDLLDYDQDGDLDIFFTNANFPLQGGELGDQLLENDGAGELELAQAAAAAPRSRDPPRPGARERRAPPPRAPRRR